MWCEVSMSETTSMSPAVARYPVEAGGAPAWRARNVATTAQARLDWTIVWRKRRPATMSPRAATKARIAGCDTEIGRASCRERGGGAGGVGMAGKKEER